MRLLRGRTFAAADTNPVVVNDRFANKFFPGQRRRRPAIQGRYRRVANDRRCCGRHVSGDEQRRAAARDLLSHRQRVDAYRPSRTASAVVDFRTFLVRTPQGRAAIPVLVGVVQAFDPSLVVWQSAMVEDVLGAALARPCAIFLLMSVFAGAGLLISAAGLYAVLAHVVALRRREFGIRIALGTSATQVQRVVLGRGLAIASVGVVLGLIGTMSLAGT